MKKFITTIPPMQRPKNLIDGTYSAVNNERLSCDFKTCFPVLPLIKGYSNNEENIEIIVLYTDDPAKCYDEETDTDISKANYDRFRKHLNAYLSNINYEINEIKIKYDETVEAHLNTFIKIIEQINEGDTVFADITFGTKPVPIIEIMALNYALRVKKDVSVGCLSYGAKNFNTGKLGVFDVTSLLYMDEMINNMAHANIENPLDMIKEIINEK